MYTIFNVAAKACVLAQFLWYSRGRPDSMNMKCLHVIGRDSWDRDGQRSVDCPEKKKRSPEEGDEAFTE